MRRSTHPTLRAPLPRGDLSDKSLLRPSRRHKRKISLLKIFLMAVETLWSNKITHSDFNRWHLTTMASMISLEDITKTYHLDTLAEPLGTRIEVPVLKLINLSIEEGEYVAIMGASGSEKSTLMNIIGCLDRPSSGQYFLAGTDLTTLDDDELADIRNQYIGFVFQQFNLLPRLTSLANVMLPMIYADVDKSQRIEQATAALVQVGLSVASRTVPISSQADNNSASRWRSLSERESPML